MSTLHITRGLPGAGKTTWAKAWVEQDPRNRVRVNRDDLRAMVYGRSDLSHTQESHITSMSHGLALAQLRRGLDVVADDTNLRAKYVTNWQQIADKAGAGFEAHDFPIDLNEAQRRDEARGGKVGSDVIAGMAARFAPGGQLQPIPAKDEPAKPEPYVLPGGPRVVVVDIDGTLALHGTRSPYDMSLVSEDILNESVADIIAALANAPENLRLGIVYCSGRSEIAREDTLGWIAAAALPPGPLFMRPEGDNRKDSIVKAELFDQHIRHHYDVIGVFDDRKQVVETWRSMGLTCLQVADGDF